MVQSLHISTFSRRQTSRGWPRHNDVVFCQNVTIVYMFSLSVDKWGSVSAISWPMLRKHGRNGFWPSIEPRCTFAGEPALVTSHTRNETLDQLPKTSAQPHMGSLFDVYGQTSYAGFCLQSGTGD
ncbi:hypothetical protein CSPAE12_06010 [Colletotrichum incanum]|nr:hypothetical protein CSPAE12_06010 [Colletotrichum incanum]